MKFDKAILESFLWETHSIEKSLQARKSILDASDNEKTQLLYKIYLNDCFLYRRVQDPGFYQYITNQIENNPAILEKAVIYIYKLFSKHIFEDDLFNFSVSGIKTDNIIDDNLKHRFREINNFQDYADSIVKESKISCDYLNKRYEYAVKNDLKDEVIVISYLLDDFTTGKCHIYKIFSLVNNDELLTNDYRWFSVYMNYFYKNLRYPDRYIRISKTDLKSSIWSINEFDTLLFRFLSPGNTIGDLISQRFGIDYRFGSNKADPDVVLVKHKFKTDFISIASEIWFSSLSEDERIKLLNGYYEFNLTKDQIDGLDFYCCNVNGELFFINGYFHEAKLLYEQGLKKSLCNMEKYSFASNLATTYRELEDYQKALKYYNKGCEYLQNIKFVGKKKKNEPRSRIKIANTKNPQHRQALEQLNIAEMKIMTGDVDAGWKDIAEVKRIIKRLSYKDKAGILSKFGALYRRTGNYREEYLVLKELHKLDDIYLTPEFEKRWEFLNFPKSILSNINPFIPGDFFESFSENTLLDCLSSEEYILSIQSFDEMAKAKEYSQKSMSALNSFSFNKALIFLKKAIELDRDPNLLSEAGGIYVDLKEHKSAFDCLFEALSMTDDVNLRAKCYIFCALNEIENENKKEILDYTKTAIIEIFESDLDSGKKTEITKKCIRQLAKRLMNKDCQISVLDILEDIEQYLMKYMNAWERLDAFVSSLLSVYAIEEAQHYLDSFLSLKSNSEYGTACALRVKGEVEYIKGNYNRALEFYLNSYDVINKMDFVEVETEFISGLNGDIAQTYGMLLDPGSGLKYIEQACEISPEDENYRNIKDKFEAFLNDRLSIQSIDNNDTKVIFNTAEFLAIEVYDKIDNIKEYDFGPVAVEYAKGLENILFVNVQPVVSKIIIEEFAIKVRNDLYNGIMKNIPYKRAFMPNSSERESITPSQWNNMEYIKKGEAARINNRIVEILRKEFGDDITDTIFEACDAVSLLDRNGAAHNKVKTKRDVLGKRKKIIEPLNRLILTFYQNKPGFNFS